HLCEICRASLKPRLLTMEATCFHGSRPVHHAFPFEPPVRNLILALKYAGRVSVVEELTALSLPVVSNLVAAGIDSVEAVPLHRVRRRERGFNQSELLARRLAAETGCPMSSALSRSMNTRPQVNLPRDQRLKNPLGAFVVEEGVRVQGSVLLLDDVVTTGATMSSAAKALMDAGAREVVCFAIAGTEGHGPESG
ncbi:MAG: ComF family protein, partial [Candidatus Eisenbacteria bacterium]|nr:ComF family protein [Candidatus Eisenbacteria bacterium]